MKPGRRKVDEVHIEIGRRIREARTRAGLAMKDLASALGVSYQQVAKYERGANRVPMDMLMQTAEILDVTIRDLLPGLAATEEDDRPIVNDLLRSVRGLEDHEIQLLCDMSIALRRRGGGDTQE